MKQITPELFAFACYQVLMSNGEGLIDKSPDYMLEKMAMLELGWQAFELLDIKNKKIIIGWLIRWKIEPPSEISAYMAGVAMVESITNKRWWQSKSPTDYGDYDPF